MPDANALSDSATSAAEDTSAVPRIEIQYPDEQLAAKMGIEITGWDRAAMTATMPVAGNRQPFGLLHGGANGVLAETLGGHAWEQAGLIWYDALTDGSLSSTATFAEFVATTLAAAARRYGEGSPERAAVASGWESVGLAPQ